MIEGRIKKYFILFDLRAAIWNSPYGEG